jgi:hypothetical protein
MFMGPKYELWTEIITTPGSSSYEVHDKVTNRGAVRQEYQLLYHLNYGVPLLEEGSQIVLPAKRVIPFNPGSAVDVDDYAFCRPPIAGFVEQLYLIEQYANQAGWTGTLLKNRNGNQGLFVGYEVKHLPCLTLWKNFAAEEDGYVIGIEPGTGYPRPRRLERMAGRVPQLGPGETHTFALKFDLLADTKSVQNAEEQIQRIQAGQPTEIVPAPEPVVA